MHFQINTDRNISGHQAFSQRVEETLEDALSRFDNQITRVEVHLSDENSSSKSGPPDKRCLLEVRLAGRQPMSVSEQARTVEEAVSGAAQKMVNSIESELGKLGRH